MLGANGYLAKHVIKELVDGGNDVIGLARSTEDALSGVRSEVFDVNSLRGVLTSLNPDIVINMTNYFTRSRTTEDVKAMVEVNCALVAEVAAACVSSGAVLLHVGSAWEVELGNPDSEAHDLYGLFRSLASEILEWFARSEQLMLYQVKLFDTYGPSDPRNKVVQLILGQLDAEKALDMSEGNQILELVHVDDVALAILRATDDIERLREDAWNFSSRTIYWCRPLEPLTLRALASLVEEIAGRAPRINWGRRPYRPGEQFVRTDDPRPPVPGWSPMMSYADGLTPLIRDAAPEIG